MKTENIEFLWDSEIIALLHNEKLTGIQIRNVKTGEESTRTNIPGVFAVGDVRTKALRQVVTAVADGATAVHYAEEYLAGGM